jgi:hypothetical protein
MFDKELNHFGRPVESDDENQVIYDRRKLNLDFGAFARPLIEQSARLQPPAVPPQIQSPETKAYSRDEVGAVPRKFSELINKSSSGLTDLFRQILQERDGAALLEEDITPANLDQLRKLYAGKFTAREERQFNFLRRAYSND